MTTFSRSLLTVAFTATFLTTLPAGETQPPGEMRETTSVHTHDPFARAIRPITNPTLFDLAIPRTQLHPIFIHQNLPSSINTTLGRVPLDGDVQIYALQLEYALSDRFSLIAAKDGYIDFNPDDVLSEETGFANLAAGFKWAFLYKPEERLALSFLTQIELPTGNSDVFQGTGDGALIPSMALLKLYDRFQFAETLGVHLPFDSDEESTTLFYSAHLSYALTERQDQFCSSL